MASDLKDDTIYLVVSFTGATSKNKESVDLVPRSWAFSENGIWSCYYPDPVDYPKRNGWLKELKDSEPEWGTYEITILKEAHDYEQAVRRRQRSYKDLNVVSTDDTECDAMVDILPTTMSKAARKIFLQQPINEVEDSQETEIISTPTSSRKPARGLRNGSSAHTDVADKTTSSPQSRRSISIVSVIEDNDMNENILTLADPQENSDDLQQEAAGVAIPDKWMNYFDRKMQELEINISAVVKSSKRSILYDIEKKINEVKNTIIVSNCGNSRGENASSAREKLGAALPIKELEAYLVFEADISSDEQKKQSLKSLFAVLIAGSNAWKDDVGKMLNAIMSKAVQIHYSGCGRKVKGKGKRNFSETTVFSCMKDVLEEHYTHLTEPLQLISRVSRWLAGAGDREGGRLVRPTIP